MEKKVPILISLMLGSGMAALDSSIVNVSLPIMQKQFGAGINAIEWVITGYMVSFCLFIPLVSWLKNRMGYYYLYLVSIGIFTIGSLVCSLSSGLPLLVAARVFQAIGGGAIAPVSLGIISESFPKEERGSAISWWGIGNVMGPAIGPTLGGLLTHYFGWPAIFYVNVPIGVIAVIMTIRYLGFLKNKPTSKPRFDITGYIYFVSFILLLQFALSLVADTKTSPYKYLLMFVSSAISLVLFIRSSKKAEPLLQLSVFKSQIFNSSAVIVFIRSLALFGGLFFLPFLLQGTPACSYYRMP
jgi:MFS transporter, DHA2 family, multidrug resistance protein